MPTNEVEQMKIKDEWIAYQNMINENDSEFLSQPAVQGTMFPYPPPHSKISIF